MKLSKEKIEEMQIRIADIIFKVTSTGEYTLEDLSLTLPALVSIAKFTDYRVWRSLKANYDPYGDLFTISLNLIKEYKRGNRFSEHIIDYLFFIMLLEHKKSREEQSLPHSEKERMISFSSKLNLQGVA